jgi:hypothetical protein
VLVVVPRKAALHWCKRWIETEEAGQSPWRRRILAAAGVVMRLLILAAAALLLWYLGVSHSAFVFFRAAPRP